MLHFSNPLWLCLRNWFLTCRRNLKEWNTLKQRSSTEQLWRERSPFAATVWFGTETAEEEKELTGCQKRLCCQKSACAKEPSHPGSCWLNKGPEASKLGLNSSMCIRTLLCMILLIFFTHFTGYFIMHDTLDPVYGDLLQLVPQYCH